MTEIRTDPRGVFVNGRREPTVAMLNFMQHIETWSGVPVDAVTRHDFWSCHDYIAANVAEATRRYGEYIRAQYQEQSRSRRTREFIGGDYGVGNNDMGIDCFDYGIFPWGDS